MIKECGFNVDVSCAFQIESGQHKMINLTISKVRGHTSSHILFGGRVASRCLGISLEGVYVNIRCGGFERSVQTNMYGNFEINLPSEVHIVEIRLSKTGFMNRCIGVYQIENGNNNCFYL